MDRFTQFGIAASQMAFKDANIEIDKTNPERIGVLVGTGFGGLATLEKNHTTLLKQGPHKISPFLIPMMIPNMCSGQIAINLGLKGPNTCVTTACASGTHALGNAFKVVERGGADVMIAGGAEATITPIMVGGFSSMKATSTRNNEPEKASRPFDKDRDGFVPAEGAGILVLEEMEAALKRGVRIYAEIAGYGLSGDAYHITAPSPDGEGAISCIKMAIDDAGISCNQVDYINAHGTSTPLNDISETQTIKAVFNSRSHEIPISSNKSIVGHLLGAAGAVEAIFTILTMRDGIVPPTINYDTPDPECDLDYVPNKSRKCSINTALSNSFGFGGTNASLIFRKNGY